MTRNNLAAETRVPPDLSLRALTYVDFVKLVDAGHPHRLVLHAPMPSWIMCVAAPGGELGVIYASMDRKARQPREFSSFKAIRSIYERFATPCREVCLPFYLDADYPYEPERRRQLIRYLDG